jgi:hypothetical protein
MIDRPRILSSDMTALEELSRDLRRRGSFEFAIGGLIIIETGRILKDVIEGREWIQAIIPTNRGSYEVQLESYRIIEIVYDEPDIPPYVLSVDLGGGLYARFGGLENDLLTEYLGEKEALLKHPGWADPFNVVLPRHPTFAYWYRLEKGKPKLVGFPKWTRIIHIEENTEALSWRHKSGREHSLPAGRRTGCGRINFRDGYLIFTATTGDAVLHVTGTGWEGSL